MALHKIGLGGGCYWCTEAIFESLKGVEKVDQGFIKSIGLYHYFSEAVIINFKPEIISMKDLIEIHLYTHQSTSNHSFRKKYRSAIYYFEEVQKKSILQILTDLQPNFEKPIITLTIPFQKFSPSKDEFLQYYKKNPEKPFCKNISTPN